MSAAFDPGNRLVIALDVSSRREADDLVQRLGGAASWVKIGLELFCTTGPDIVRDYVARGLRVMLDLKLHDIPKTVERSAAAVAGLGAELLTVHAAGGRAMLESAVKACRDGASGDRRTRVLAVTVLTSMDEADLTATGQVGPSLRLVLDRSKLAHEAGCDGVVASAMEAALVRATLPRSFLIATPGIRRMGGEHESGTLAGDQKRVATPGSARRSGADLLVIGRPVRDAEDPAAACRAISNEIRAIATERIDPD